MIETSTRFRRVDLPSCNLAAHDQETVTTLVQLPQEVAFPDSIAPRIRYDAGQRRLIFRGFMSRLDFELLHGLSKDLLYQRAIADLFRDSAATITVQRPSRLRPIAVGVATIAASLVALKFLTGS